MIEDEVVCRCEEITYREILEAVESGCSTLKEIKKKTRATMGFCQGKCCRAIIAGILAKKLNKDISGIEPDKTRPPVEAINIKIF